MHASLSLSVEWRRKNSVGTSTSPPRTLLAAILLAFTWSNSLITQQDLLLLQPHSSVQCAKAGWPDRTPHKCKFATAPQPFFSPSRSFPKAYTDLIKRYETVVAIIISWQCKQLTTSFFLFLFLLHAWFLSETGEVRDGAGRDHRLLNSHRRPADQYDAGTTTTGIIPLRSSQPSVSLRSLEFDRSLQQHNDACLGAWR